MKHLSSGLLAILMDRDGVINEEPGPVLEPAEFRMISGSAEAVARINETGWLDLTDAKICVTFWIVVATPVRQHSARRQLES